MKERSTLNTSENLTPDRARSPGPGSTSELLILPDGKILVHNLTLPFARLLQELNPDEGQIQPRADRAAEVQRTAGNGPLKES
jgi:hypothetical protein